MSNATAIAHSPISFTVDLRGVPCRAFKKDDPQARSEYKTVKDGEQGLV
jgi:hypothetical protein